MPRQSTAKKKIIRLTLNSGIKNLIFNFVMLGICFVRHTCDKYFTLLMPMQVKHFQTLNSGLITTGNELICENIFA